MTSLMSRLFGLIGAARFMALACLAAVLAIRILDPLPVEISRLKTFDFYQTLKPRDMTPQPVAIVDIDEKSLKELGQWPWPRSLIADMLLKLGQAGVPAIAFDMVFPEDDRLSPGPYARSIPNLSEVARKELESLPNNDELMANIMRQMRIVAGQAGRAKLEDTDREPQAQTPVALLGPDPKPFLLDYPKLLRNIPAIEDAAAGKGLFSIFPDWDSIVRRAALVAVADGKIQPALSTELLRVGTGQNAFAVKSDEAGIKSLVVAGVEVPTDRNGRIWVHYTPHQPSRFVSASDVVNGTVDPNRLRGHLVLVGTSATGLLDLKATPLDPAMPGVEVHAQIVETILSKSSLTRPNFALGAELTVIVLLSVLVIIFVPVLGALPVLFFGFLLSAGWAGTSWYFFSEQKVLLDATYPLGASFSVFLLLMFLNYRREEVRRREIRSAFGQYLAPDYVERIAEDPESLKLGGETRRMSILFSDVRGFTTISESFKDNPQGLTNLMNGFLTPLSNAILERHGTIDKYMGDAIMAFWNAPVDDTEHERNACAAALDMMRRMRALNVERKAEAEATGGVFRELKVGVGINTGEVVVGNMGSEFRFDYSVLGDSVNLASRLEGQSKTYGVDIILGDETANAASDYAVGEIDLIRVKGKNEPVRIHALFGDPDHAKSAGFHKDKAFLEELIRAYRAQDWDVAKEAISGLKQSEAQDFHGLAALFEERIGEFMNFPPPADWDGVFVAQSK